MPYAQKMTTNFLGLEFAVTENSRLLYWKNKNRDIKKEVLLCTEKKTTMKSNRKY